MSTTITKSPKLKPAKSQWRTGTQPLGIQLNDPLDVVKLVQEGFSYSHLTRFEKCSGFSRDQIAVFTGISKRSLFRRQSSGRLTSDESDRVLRASRVFGMAVELFEGDIEAARRWLLTPQKGIDGEIPQRIAATDVGAREVEYLIIRLEHGVFS